MDEIAEELVEMFLNGNITDTFENLEVLTPIQAAYLSYKIGFLLPSCSRDSFERALVRRM